MNFNIKKIASLFLIIIIINTFTINKVLCKNYYVSHGCLITYADVKKLNKHINKTIFIENFGTPIYVIKTKKYDIFLYYFLDNTAEKENRIITRYLSVIFENSKETLQSIYFFN